MKGTNGKGAPGSPGVPHLQSDMDAAPQYLSIFLFITPVINMPQLFHLNRQRICLIASAPFIHFALRSSEVFVV